MSSSSTTLLRKVLWAKLQSWLRYINGEGNEQFRLAKQPESILIQKVYDTTPISPVSAMLSTYSDSAGVWLHTIVTIEFKEELTLIIKDKSIWGMPILSSTRPVDSEVIRISYSDPEFYKKIFAIVDRAKERAIA